MENENITTGSVKWTDESITDLIRKLRNDLIKDFLDERNLIAYFAEQYNRKEITTVKIQFMKKDLKELLIAPVDLRHYASLVEQIRLSDSASITEKHDQLFYKEVEMILKRYL